MEYSGRTDIGKDRTANEDSFLMLEKAPFYLFMVADGMGGHAAGDVASSLAADSLRDYFEKNIYSLEKTAEDKQIEQFFSTMLEQANAQIWKHACSHQSRCGMGTTLSAVLLNKDKYYIGHIGDSRVYLVGEGEIRQLTRDHSLVAALVEKGELSKEEADSHPQRNILTRAFGTAPAVPADYYSGRVNPGEYLLLCTDGLTSMVSDGEIFAACRDKDSPERIVDYLVLAANERGGHDNITVIVIRTSKVRGDK
ncbi:MAG TPA: Stp1/IreP family PP2C-type Ser/Thr phosphatase [Firmicutes bacterium]|nr:Stp1/IreP family PP2C-type Ser/Thr phosphatase [Bacillota bacterium]